MNNDSYFDSTYADEIRFSAVFRRENNKKILIQFIPPYLRKNEAYIIRANYDPQINGVEQNIQNNTWERSTDNPDEVEKLLQKIVDAEHRSQANNPV